MKLKMDEGNVVTVTGIAAACHMKLMKKSRREKKQQISHIHMYQIGIVLPNFVQTIFYCKMLSKTKSSMKKNKINNKII